MKNRITTKIFGCRFRRLRGFTLIEIMTASAISLVIITALLGVTQAVLSNFRDIRGGSLREADAGVALDMIVRDLEALVVSPAPDSQSLQVTSDSVGDINGGDSMWLTFLSSTVDDDAHPGAARAVSYRLAYQNPIGASVQGDDTYALYRAVADAEETFTNAVGVADLQNYWSGKGTRDVENYLVGNIIGFKVRFAYKEAQNPAIPADPVSNPIVVKWTTSGDLPIEIGEDGSKLNGTSVPGGFIAAEVSLTALKPEGAKILETPAVNLYTGSDYSETIIRFIRSYTQKTAVFPQAN